MDVPLANVVAVYEPTPPRRAERERELRASGRFATVTTHPSGWILGRNPLPSDAPPPRSRTGRTYFEGPEAEGSGPDDWPPAGDVGYVEIGDDAALRAVRSCGGLIPVYHWASEGCAIVATTLTDLVQCMAEPPALDPLVNAVWATGYGFFPGNRTFFAGVSILPRGRALTWSPGVAAASTESYWDPRPLAPARPDPRRAAEHVDRFRELLLRTLRRDLDPGGANLLTLSGGVDSSALAALIRGSLDLDVSTWSLFPADAEAYEQSARYVRLLADRYGFTRSWELRSGLGTRAELIKGGPAVAFYVPHPALCDLERIQAEGHFRVLVGGEFADEICGSRFTYPDWARGVGLPWLVRNARALPRGPLQGGAYWLRQRLRSVIRRHRLPFPAELSSFVRPEVVEEYRDWLAEQRAVLPATTDRRSALTARSNADGWLAMNWEVTSRLGLRRSAPFHTRAMIELGYACHPTELVGPGPETKQLLRRALRGRVPDACLDRADRGHWSPPAPGPGELQPVGPLPASMAPIVRPEVLEAPTAPATDAEQIALSLMERFAASVEALIV